MTQVKDLVQHIANLQPEKDASRLCFYQYLRNLADPFEPVTSELCNRFFLRALSFAHWQADQSHLFSEVEALLGHFQANRQRDLKLGDRLKQTDLQVFKVDSKTNLKSAIEKYCELHSDPLEQTRIMDDGENLVRISLKPDRTLRVTQFSNSLALIRGEVRPVHQDFTLFYGQEIEMRSGVVQQIEVGPHMAARFDIGVEGVRGVVVRGYTFQRCAVFEGGGIERHSLLFYAVKKLERLYVARKSDPVYLDLISLLERAIELLNDRGNSITNATSVLTVAKTALDRGRMAIEHIYGEDRLLRLLTDNLEKSLALKDEKWPQIPDLTV